MIPAMPPEHHPPVSVLFDSIPSRSIKPQPIQTIRQHSLTACQFCCLFFQSSMLSVSLQVARRKCHAINAQGGSMFTRSAIFEGTIHKGQEDAFFQMVEERLLPVWKRMPNAQAVRVMRTVDSDPDSPPIAMVQEVDYPSMDA
eukprot:gene29786-36627_t